MASRIQAINAYRPRVKLGRTAGNEELVDFIARSIGLKESGVRQALLANHATWPGGRTNRW